jgi:hypothetical protein
MVSGNSGNRIYYRVLKIVNNAYIRNKKRVNAYIRLRKEILFTLFPPPEGGRLKESIIERELKNKIQQLGGICLKWSSPGNRGVPDRIILYQGDVIFVELKRPGQKLRPLQEYQRRKFQELGVDIEVIDSMEGVEEFVKRIQGA